MLLPSNAMWKSVKCSTDNIIFATDMAKLVITQIKSGIDRPEVQKRTLKALGLSMHKTVELEATPQIRGMITKVQHLVRVTEK